MSSKIINDKLSIVMKSEKNINVFSKALQALNLRPEDLSAVLYQISFDISVKKMPLPEVLKKVKENKISWKSECFTQCIQEEEEQDNFTICPFEVSEGVLECKCGSKRVFSYQRQTRGLDESATTFAECVKCGNKWVYSG